MAGISLHVVDVARGRPASGMRVEVFHLGPVRQLLASGELDAGGTLQHEIVRQTLPVGTYEVLFDAGTFFADATLNISDPPFLGIVPFRFNLADPSLHYHLPLKITPWGFSIYRGA